MAGTLFGLGLSVVFDPDTLGVAPGALLYIYDANSSSPAQTFSDFTLGTLQTFPIVADGAGRLPALWVDDGSYRARLTTADGVEIFDEASITAIGASVTSGSSGSSGTTVDATAVHQTGDLIWNAVTGTRTGWVRANGRTIGSSASGATERANSDTQTLFEYLWNNFTNTLCPVSSGRGAGATSDFNSNKTMGLLDMRGRSIFGLDDMGNTAASRIVAGTPTAISSGGAETVTIAQANLPSVSLSAASLVATVTDPGHTHSYTKPSNDHNTSVSGGQPTSDAGSGNTTGSNTTGITVAMSGSVPLGGSGTATNKMPPYMLGSWYFKL